MENTAQAAKHPCKGIVRGNARGQWHQALKPVLVLLAELGHLYAVVCACDGGAQRDAKLIELYSFNDRELLGLHVMSVERLKGLE